MARQSASREALRREVADRLHSASIRLLRRLRRVDRVEGIGPARLSALAVIVFGGPLTLGRLADAEQVTPATVSRLVTGLESLGLATRRPDTKDGRVTWIEATARGRRLLERGRERRLNELREQLDALDDDDLDVLARASALLERLARGGDGRA